MDTLKNKKYLTYDYISRYSTVPSFYDTLNGREIMGIGYNMEKLSSVYTHKVRDTDTLDSLALYYYNNPSYWWIIAYYNDIQDAFVRLADKYTVLQIPNIASIKFGRTN